MYSLLFLLLKRSNKYIIDVQVNDLSPIFVLAHTCLNHAKTISSNKKAPTVPPKPACLSLPPPLPIRPFLDTDMIRTRSDFEKRACTIDYSSDEDEEEYNVNNNKKGKLEIINLYTLYRYIY